MPLALGVEEVLVVNGSCLKSAVLRAANLLEKLVAPQTLSFCTKSGSLAVVVVGSAVVFYAIKSWKPHRRSHSLRSRRDRYGVCTASWL